MKKNTIAALAFFLLFAAGLAHSDDYSKNHLRGYAKTVDEAFALGVKLAEDADFEIGEGKNCLKPDAKIKILPEKEKGLYVVEVHDSAHKGPCNPKPK